MFFYIINLFIFCQGIKSQDIEEVEVYVNTLGGTASKYDLSHGNTL